MAGNDTVQVKYEDDFGDVGKARKMLIAGTEYFVPQSQIREHDKVSKVIEVPRWLAEKNGWDHE